MNYQKLGFKCGIEIHQQLIGRKLFCHCPAINSKEEPDIKIIRKLRASAGETGEIDIAAKHEIKKDKYLMYECNSEDTCLVELDEEPPHDVDVHSLDTSLIVAKLLNCEIVDKVQFMRKTVVDGSNTTGFQRTALVGKDGYLETSKGKVGITNVCLEEEAAQKLDETDEYIRYKLDRLGISLVEIGTDASIQDPEHAKEVASTLGMILRSTERVKRGIGTIRQDVNVSIKGHPRVEIKGFQDLRSIQKTIENEVERQKKEKKAEPHVRKAESDFTTSFMRPMPGAARMYVETDVNIVDVKNRLKLIKLPELITDKAINLEKKYKLSDVMANEIIKAKVDFETYVNKFKNTKPELIANILINVPKDIKSRLNEDSSKLKQEDFMEILSYLDKNQISKEAITELLVKKIKNEKISLGAYKAVDDSKLEDEIKKIIKAKPGLNAGAYMGILMGKFRGKVDGKKIMEILKKNL